MCFCLVESDYTITFRYCLINAAHDGGFLGNNDQSAVLPAIPKNAESPVWNTLFHALANAPLDVIADGAAFLLRKRSEQRQQQLAALRQCINSFFLEPNRNPQFLQATDGYQHVQRVAGEAGKALGQDDIDVPGLTLSDHALKFRAIGARSADAVVGEDARVLPARVALD